MSALSDISRGAIVWNECPMAWPVANIERNTRPRVTIKRENHGAPCSLSPPRTADETCEAESTVEITEEIAVSARPFDTTGSQ